MPRPTDSPILTPLPPSPPNWHERYQGTVTSLKNYKLFPVDTNTFEYATIASMLDPALISTVKQIVNPTLCSRFVNTRKDMLKSKCNDLELLSKLDLHETELMASYQHSLNFDVNPNVQVVPYTDNMALLFHCTRDPNNIEKIICQGLDERMGTTAGLLRKGIYFTGNPEKSITYDGCGGIIFLFAVLLGDCLTLDGPMYDFLREPEKWPQQKRNFNDLFFDSIVGHPGINQDNEYVIYNRSQCCPLYMVEYSPASWMARDNADSVEYKTSRTYFPPCGWTSQENFYVTPAQVQNSWPFHAKTIFAKMGALVETPEESQVEEEDKQAAKMETLAEVVGKQAKSSDGKTKRRTTLPKPSGLTSKLNFLNELGLHDLDENIEVLRKHKFDLNKCVSYLLDQQNATNEI